MNFGLYSNILQIDKIDWNAVAEANGLSKGAAYMRYSRITASLGDDTSPSTSPKSSPSKRKRNVKSEDTEEVDILASPTKKKRGPRKKNVDMLEHYEGSSSGGDAPLPGSLIVEEFPELASYY